MPSDPQPIAESAGSRLVHILNNFAGGLNLEEKEVRAEIEREAVRSPAYDGSGGRVEEGSDNAANQSAQADESWAPAGHLEKCRVFGD